MFVLLLGVLVCLLGLYLLRVPLLEVSARALIENDPPRKAGCALVLGGDDFGTRIVKAAQLIREGYAPYALVDGPPRLIGHESDTTIEYAVQQGFPQTIFHPLYLPQEVNSTWSEAKFMGGILNRQGVKTVLLVTSNYHTRRSARFFRAANPGLQVVVIAAPDPYFTPTGWWKNRAGKRTFLLEWTKTLTERGGR